MLNLRRFLCRTGVVASLCLTLSQLANASFTFATSIPDAVINDSNWPSAVLYPYQLHNGGSWTDGTTAYLDIHGLLSTGGQTNYGDTLLDPERKGTLSALGTFTVNWAPTHTGDIAPSTVQIKVLHYVRAQALVGATPEQGNPGTVQLHAEASLLDPVIGNCGVGSIDEIYPLWFGDYALQTNGNFYFALVRTSYITATKNAGSNTYTFSVETGTVSCDAKVSTVVETNQGAAGAGASGEVEEKLAMTIVG